MPLAGVLVSLILRITFDSGGGWGAVPVDRPSREVIGWVNVMWW